MSTVDVKITRQAILQLIERQNYRCALTGRDLVPATARLDHIVPLSRGGTHSMDNLWVIHEHVNRAKATLTVEEFVAMCREVADHAANS